jgi:predicted O-linked N-acetylglucosamine transferase (SPINDLY family)
MSQFTIPQALQIAIGHHHAGRWVEAARIYRQILATVPDQADALHLLGVLSSQTGHLTAAIELIGRAISINPAVSEYHSNLGESYRRAGECDRAIASFRRAIELNPNLADAHNSLGVALREKGQPDDAIAAYNHAIRLRPEFAEAHNNLGNVLSDKECPDAAIAAFNRALQIKPDYAEALSNLGSVLGQQGRIDEAIAACRSAIQLRPNLADAHNNLGITLMELGRLDEAIDAYNRTIQLTPGHAEAHMNLGTALYHQGRLAEAVHAYNRAIELRPDHTKAHNNLGNALIALGRPDEAIIAIKRAIELKPMFAEAHNTLGNALKEKALLGEALACFRRAVELKPTFHWAACNLIYNLHFHPDYDAPAILAEHRRWDAQFAAPLAHSIPPHCNDPAPDRRLRIGYVSPDFRVHPVGRFILPLFESHDHANFEIFCYASLMLSDAITSRCRARADVWREVYGFSDEQVAHAIRQDRIDILVDLTMHMANTRILIFARKPAPVQVTYLAYCGTTGLSTMDYRLTDPYLDPPRNEVQPYSEESIHLPETYWCYQPLIETPSVNALPALESGQITFGCLNNFCKVSEPTLEAWSQLLRALPGARLLLHAPSGSHRERVRSVLSQNGIAPDRLMFVGLLPVEEYFRIHGQIDVALDPFPYGGGTTTCDALWMGVPVVSLAGRTAVGRGGLSILSNLGLSELVARDVPQYVHIARDLARDRPRLIALRAGLRDRMRQSPLMDAPRFARGIEAAYRRMWQRWCARASPPSPQ